MSLPLSCRLPRSPRSWWGECWHMTPVLPPLQRPTVAALSLSASRPDWQSLEDIDMPLRQHSLSVSIDEGRSPSPPLVCALHPCPCPGPLHCSTSCWGLAERGPICCSGSPSGEFRCCLRYWLHGCATPLHLLHVCPECHSTADRLWEQWGQNSTSQCHP